jgi:hypothetical protein
MADKFLRDLPTGTERRFRDLGNGVWAPEVFVVNLAPARFSVATALLTVPTNAYTTVVALTPTEDVLLVGYNADFKAVLNASYRMRLLFGPDSAGDAGVQHAEEVNSTANSWQPLKLTISAGQRVAVQVFHAEVTGQVVRATINYQEG